MTSANLDNNHETVEPPGSQSPPLVSSDAQEKDDSKTDAIIDSQASSSSSPTPITEQPASSENAENTVQEEPEIERQRTPTPSPRESRSNSTSEEPTASNEEVKVEGGVVVEEQPIDDQRPTTSPKVDKQYDPKRPMDPNSVLPQKITPHTSTEERTSELIKKQMNEIG